MLAQPRTAHQSKVQAVHAFNGQARHPSNDVDAPLQWPNTGALSKGGCAIGRLVRGLDEAAGRGWVVADMKQEWARIF